MHGRGILTSEDNKKYDGTFKEGKKDGFGVFHWNNDNMFEGYWVNSKMHGIGKFITKGNYKVGLWENGKRINWLKSIKD